MNEEQLKEALVRALPHKLANAGNYFWLETYNGVTDHEWTAIVAMVEEKLTQMEWTRYLSAIALLAKKTNQSEIRILDYMLATWQVRAQALVNIGVIK